MRALVRREYGLDSINATSSRYFCVKCGDPDANCSCSAMYAWRRDGNLQPVAEDGQVFRDTLAKRST